MAQVSTTSISIELMVVGLGAAAWVCLLVLAGFGHDWVPVDVLLSPSTALPILGFVYLIGIVVDRIADATLGSLWATRNRGRVYGALFARYDDDERLVLAIPEFRALFDYNKSRQRICRGWIFNACLLLVSLHVYLWSQHHVTPITVRVAVLGSGLCIALAAGCWFSGGRLNAAQYEKVKGRAERFKLPEKEGVRPATSDAEVLSRGV